MSGRPRAGLRLPPWICGAAAVVMTAAAAAHAAPDTTCASDRAVIRSGADIVVYRVEIADDNESRARGLMFREHLDRDAGMLFLFDPPRPVSFWMRNTPLPLDLIYIDAAGEVTKIAERAVPFSEALLPSDGTVRAVLEINGGEARKMGLEPGDVLRHPGIAAEKAAWPCG